MVPPCLLQVAGSCGWVPRPNPPRNIYVVATVQARGPRGPPPHVASMIRRAGRHTRSEQPHEREPAGWAESYLFQMADANLSQLLDKASWASPLRQCAGDLLALNLTAAQAQLALVGTSGDAETGQHEELVSGIAHRLPCKSVGCCWDLGPTQSGIETKPQQAGLCAGKEVTKARVTRRRWQLQSLQSHQPPGLQARSPAAPAP